MGNSVDARKYAKISGTPSKQNVVHTQTFGYKGVTQYRGNIMSKEMKVIRNGTFDTYILFNYPICKKYQMPRPRGNYTLFALTDVSPFLLSHNLAQELKRRW